MPTRNSVEEKILSYLVLVGCFAILGASCSDGIQQAEFATPSLNGETMPERAAAFEELALSMPLEALTLEGGVIEEREPDNYSAQSYALYPAADSNEDYDGWLVEVWEVHRALEKAGFEGVHFNCSNNFVATHQFRAFYENSDEVLIRLDWPFQRPDQGALVAEFIDGRPERFSDVQFEPGPNPEMCLPAES